MEKFKKNRTKYFIIVLLFVTLLSILTYYEYPHYIANKTQKNIKQKLNLILNQTNNIEKIELLKSINENMNNFVIISDTMQYKSIKPIQINCLNKNVAEVILEVQIDTDKIKCDSIPVFNITTNLKTICKIFSSDREKLFCNNISFTPDYKNDTEVFYKNYIFQCWVFENNDWKYSETKGNYIKDNLLNK